MAARKETWDAFREKMKNKRCKKAGSAVNKGLSAGDLVIRNGELVVQRLSAEVSGKAQKYSRIGPREFVPFDEEEVSIIAIKAAFERHYKSLTEQGLKCDVLAGDQGPSCFSLSHIPDLKVVHVRFIKSQETTTTRVTRPSEFSFMTSMGPPVCYTSEYVEVKDSPRKRKIKSEMRTPNAAKKHAPKSLTVSQMMRLGKLIKTDVADESQKMIVDVFNFDFQSLSWSLLPQTVEFTVEKTVLGEGGFRKAYKACSNHHGFKGKEWVVKRHLEDVVEDVKKDLGQSMEEQTKKVVQMHHLSKNLAEKLSEKVKQKKVCAKFGPVMQFQLVYFGMVQGTGECVTIEPFITGEFEKYVNNTGELCVPKDNLLGQKAECLAHFSYEVSNKQLMVLDLQGSGHVLYDPEIASKKLVAESDEFLFCAGNLSDSAIKLFIEKHECNMFCHLVNPLGSRSNMTSCTKSLGTARSCNWRSFWCIAR